MKPRLAALAAAVLLAAAATASADVEARAQLGFGGRWVVDAATPLVVELKNTGGAPVMVDITVAQGEGIAMNDAIHRRMVRLMPGATRAEVFLVPGVRAWNGGLRINLEVDPTVPLHTPTASADRGSISLEVAGENAAFSTSQIPFATRVLGVALDPRNVVVSRIDSTAGEENKNDDGTASRRLRALSVPDELLRLAPLGLDGLDALLVCDPDAQFGTDPVVADGLLDWVALGGTLAVSLGEHAGGFAASPLASEMPATWAGAGRTNYSDLLADLPVSAQQTGQEGPWIELKPNALAADTSRNLHAGTPVRVVRHLGMGRIVLLPYDLRLAAANPGLSDRDTRALFGPFVPPTPERNKDENQWYGSDFSSTVFRTLQAGAFEPPPLPLVMLGIVLYVVVVGPIDWVVLKRLRKERLTTFTFLGAVIAFTLLAYGASLLLFSKGARVNRIVVADLVDAGREGRQAFRYQDIAGFYSPTGSDQDVQYSSPCVVLPPGLPGFGTGGDVGTPMPVYVASADPLHPRARVQLAFRSQRVVRVAVVGTLGPTIDVEWNNDGRNRGVRVTNGLPVDLDDVAIYVGENTAYSLGPVAAGASSHDGQFQFSSGRRARDTGEGLPMNRGWGRAKPLPRDGVRRFLEGLTIGSWSDVNQPHFSVPDEVASLRKGGISRNSAFTRGHALVVAHASKFPAALPGAGGEGDVYVVLRKEVPIP